jgi:hypothetical protein
VQTRTRTGQLLRIDEDGARTLILVALPPVLHEKTVPPPPYEAPSRGGRCLWKLWRWRLPWRCRLSRPSDAISLRISCRSMSDVKFVRGELPRLRWTSAAGLLPVTLALLERAVTGGGWLRGEEGLGLRGEEGGWAERGAEGLGLPGAVASSLSASTLLTRRLPPFSSTS